MKAETIAAILNSKPYGISAEEWIADQLTAIESIWIRRAELNARVLRGDQARAKELAEIEVERAALRKECPHYSTTYQHGIGDMRSYGLCDHCGKEL